MLLMGIGRILLLELHQKLGTLSVFIGVFLGWCLVFVIVSVVSGNEAATPPQWPDCYFVSGVLRLPYAEINEPFAGYLEAKKNRSRVDYYGN